MPDYNLITKRTADSEPCPTSESESRSSRCQ